MSGTLDKGVELKLDNLKAANKNSASDGSVRKAANDDWSSVCSFQIQAPTKQTCPFVFDSPHSGRFYPQSFINHSCLNALQLRSSEDYLVDKLFEAAPKWGASLIKANFPRAFVDLNREPYELDAELIEGDLPEFANTSSVRVLGGLGTIPRNVAEHLKIYAKKIDKREVFARLDYVYAPYHAALRRLIAKTYVQFGYAVLIDCHSMPEHGRGPAKPDIIIGDRYGASCDGGLSSMARKIFADLGYKVSHNSPYAGGFITQHYGRPENGLHCIQIEINRGLYMDEKQLRPLGHFSKICADMSEFIARIVQYQDTKLQTNTPLAAE